MAIMKPIPVPNSPMGALTRRRPLLTLKPKAAKFDDGGLVERDIDVSPVDAMASGAISNEGGFLGSPEIGGTRGDPASPNNSSGLTAAQDAMANPGFGDKAMDLLVGPQELTFDPITGEFTAARDYAGALGRAAVSSMFGPLGPLVSMGMRAGSKYGEPIDDERVGRGNQRGADMWRGGRVHLAGGGAPGQIPPEVAAIIQAAMAAKGGAPAGAQGQAAMPPAPPQREPFPLDFIPPAAELVRRYGGGEQAVAEAALASGGSPTRSGLFRGPGGGRSDAIPAELDPEGFVMTAAHVKEQGDGSPERGAAKIASKIGNPAAARPVPTVKGGQVPARVSNGEMYLDPADTARAGGASALEAAGAGGKRRKRGRGQRR